MAVSSSCAKNRLSRKRLLCFPWLSAVTYPYWFSLYEVEEEGCFKIKWFVFFIFFLLFSNEIRGSFGLLLTLTLCCP